MVRFHREMSLAVAGVGILIAATLPALGQQASGSLALRGTMETICYIAVNQQIDTVDIVKGTSTLTIGTVSERCNKANGFTITISSANAGALVSAAGDRAPYTVHYDNSGSRSLAEPLVVSRSEAQTTENSNNFRVKFPAKNDAIAGDYVDTITLTIAAR
jgi:spore coat protein U-like protein